MNNIISSYEVDGTLSRHGGIVIVWKVSDVTYGSGFVCKVVTLHILDSDVFECLSVRFKRIGYYAFGFTLNRIFDINLLVLVFRLNPRHALPKISDAALHVFNHLMKQRISSVYFPCEHCWIFDDFYTGFVERKMLLERI